MPVAFVVEIPGMTTGVYDRVMDHLEWGPGNLPEGFISHCAAEMPDGLFMCDVWESAADWQRFAETDLGAALEAVTGGQAPELEPRFYPIHRQEHR